MRDARRTARDIERAERVIALLSLQGKYHSTTRTSRFEDDSKKKLRFEKVEKMEDEMDKEAVLRYARAMQRIDGRALAERIRSELATKIQEQQLNPGLGVLLVGTDTASEMYVNMKHKAAHTVGIQTDIRHVAATTRDEELQHIIRGWNADERIHGILVQLPLPEGHDTDAIIQTIMPAKDADGFHPENTAALLAGHGTIIPPLHEGILRLIGQTPLRLQETSAVILSNSDIFSQPLRYLLERGGARVHVFDPDHFDRQTVREAQLVVIAIGRLKFLTRDMISEGVCIIDVGTHRISDKQVVGDVDAESLADVPGWLSPVPGGVGPMTIAMLLKNVTELAKRKTTDAQT